MMYTQILYANLSILFRLSESPITIGGEVVMDKKVPGNQTMFSVDTLENGTYYIHLTSKDKNEFYRLIIQK